MHVEGHLPGLLNLLLLAGALMLTLGQQALTKQKNLLVIVSLLSIVL